MSIQSNGKHHTKTVKGIHRKNELVQPTDYSDGKTKQCYKDECDISKIMLRAEKAGTISHLEKYEGVYADYSEYDFLEQTQILAEGRQIFSELPAELRQEFNQSPQQFFTFVNDADNAGQLHTLLPALANSGRQLLQATAQPAEPLAAEPATVVADPPTDPPVVELTPD